MMREPAPSDQESTYLKAPEGAQRFAIQDGKVLVYVAGSDMQLRFLAATAVESK